MYIPTSKHIVVTIRALLADAPSELRPSSLTWLGLCSHSASQNRLYSYNSLYRQKIEIIIGYLNRGPRGRHIDYCMTLDRGSEEDVVQLDLWELLSQSPSLRRLTRELVYILHAVHPRRVPDTTYAIHQGDLLPTAVSVCLPPQILHVS